MNPFILLILGFFALAIGVLLGYFVRQSLAKRQAGTIEAKLQKKITQAKAEAEQLFTETKEKAQKILDEVKRQE